MKTAPKTAGAIAGLSVAVCALFTGCQSVIQGNPVHQPDSGTEPSFPTPRQGRPTAAPPMPSTPEAEVLQPHNGYVFIQTKSGKTRCQISDTDVGCESAFTDSPVLDGERANGVRLSADGQVQWLVGNLGDIPAVTLDYRNYRALNWTIDASSEGTRFTNDVSGHGMVVAVEGIQTF
jgi:hypothetical protein